MEVKFIGQGLEKKEEQIGHIVNDTLKSGKYHTFYAFVAFVSESGVDRLRESLITFMSIPNNSTQLFVGVDNKATSKEALDVLIEMNVPTYIYHNLTSSVIYHPKIYYFKGENEFKLINGSSNLTLTGLFQNVETSLIIDSDYDQGKELFQSLESFFEKFINKTDPNLKELDSSLLKELETLGIVPIESSINYSSELSYQPREQAENNDSTAEGTEANNILESVKDHFPKREVPSAPPRFTPKIRTTSAPETSDAPGPSGVPWTPDIPETLDASGSLTGELPDRVWFMSGKLTGGSRNILDLSLRGRNGGTGGVQLLNPSLVNNYEFTLRYNGVDYHENVVKYPLTPAGEGNGTWRLQMRGVSASGQRFTDYTRNYQLMNQILIFTRIGDNHFELTVEPDSRLSYYQTNSTIVDQSPPNGRFYGRI